MFEIIFFPENFSSNQLNNVVKKSISNNRDVFKRFAKYYENENFNDVILYLDEQCNRIVVSDVSSTTDIVSFIINKIKSKVKFWNLSNDSVIIIPSWDEVSTIMTYEGYDRLKAYLNKHYFVQTNKGINDGV